MKIRISPDCVLYLTALLLSRNSLFAATVLSAAFHELGHILAARLMCIPLKSIELNIMGAKLTPAGMLPSYRAELCLSAAGPLFSILLWGILLPHGGDFAAAARTATLSFAVFNLLPINGFDGGRVLSCLAAPLLGVQRTERLGAICSYLSLLLLFSLSSCMLLRYGESLSLTVLCASLFARLFL